MKSNTFFTSVFFALTVISMQAHSESIQTTSIKTQKDCFSGMFESFDTWFDELYSVRQRRFEMQGVQDAAKKLASFESGFKEMFNSEQFQVAKNNLDCKFITYEVNGEDIEGVLITPKNIESPAPVIIYNRGGTRNLGSLVFGHLAYELFPIALEGYAIIASQYRKHEQYGADNIDEVVALFDIIDSTESLNSKKVGVYGVSRGGMTSWQLAKEMPDRISAMVTSSGVTNSRLWSQNRPGILNNIELIKGYESDAKDIFNRLSSVEWVEQTSTAPILLIHSRDDNKVNVQHSLQMAQELSRLERVYKMVIYEDGGHDLLGHKKGAFKTKIDWFNKYLNH